jgi:hypothetical protein
LSVISDPQLRAAPRFALPSEGEAVALPPRTPIARSLRSRIWAYATVGVFAAAVTLRLVASMLAVPLDAPGAVAAPTWFVEVTTNNSTPGTALVYGREVGLQFVQLPAGDGSPLSARIVPARLAKGELHMVSLGLSALRVSSAGPPGSGVANLTATGRIISAYQTKTETGVRAGW